MAVSSCPYCGAQITYTPCVDCENVVVTCPNCLKIVVIPQKSPKRD